MPGGDHGTPASAVPAGDGAVAVEGTATVPEQRPGSGRACKATKPKPSPSGAPVLAGGTPRPRPRRVLLTWAGQRPSQRHRRRARPAPNRGAPRADQSWTIARCRPGPAQERDAQGGAANTRRSREPPHRQAQQPRSTHRAATTARHSTGHAGVRIGTIAALHPHPKGGRHIGDRVRDPARKAWPGSQGRQPSSTGGARPRWSQAPPGTPSGYPPLPPPPPGAIPTTSPHP